MTAVLVGTEHATRHLSVNAADEVEVVVGSAQGGRIAADEIVFSRFAETLGDVDVVPVGQSALLHPVGGTTMDFLGKLKQEGLARAVVEPNDAKQVVAAT